MADNTTSTASLRARFEQKASESEPPKRNFINKSGLAVNTLKCLVCGKSVYPMEKIEIESKPYHKVCLKCETCKRTLGLGNYAALEGRFYCKPHLKQLFQLKGNYDEGFGRKQRKKDWVKNDDPSSNIIPKEQPSTNQEDTETLSSAVTMPSENGLVEPQADDDIQEEKALDGIVTETNIGEDSDEVKEDIMTNDNASGISINDDTDDVNLKDERDEVHNEVLAAEEEAEEIGEVNSEAETNGKTDDMGSQEDDVYSNVETENISKVEEKDIDSNEETDNISSKEKTVDGNFELEVDDMSSKEQVDYVSMQEETDIDSKEEVDDTSIENGKNDIDSQEEADISSQEEIDDVSVENEKNDINNEEQTDIVSKEEVNDIRSEENSGGISSKEEIYDINREEERDDDDK